MSHCKLSQKVFNDLTASPQLRSVEILLFRENRVVTVIEPDIDEADEKQRSKVMKLKLLDLRDNRLQSIYLRQAPSFLRETVVFMMGNPFSDSGLASLEHTDPSHLFRASDDDVYIRNPLHLLTASPATLALMEDL